MEASEKGRRSIARKICNLRLTAIEKRISTGKNCLNYTVLLAAYKQLILWIPILPLQDAWWLPF
jgi:hypothetical protein